jgi:predicted phosphodiesterase
MKLRSAVDDMNVNRTLDLVVHLGDLVDHAMHKNLGPIMDILKSLKAPLFHVLGNHDFEEEDIDKVPKMLGLQSRYYTFTQKNYRFVVLDGNDLSLYATHPGTTKRKLSEDMYNALKRRRTKNAQYFNGGLDKDQMEWMKGELDAGCKADQRVIVLVHHPMRPKDEPTNLWNDLDVVRVIISYPCVVAVVNGHAHKFLYDFHHAVHGDVHFITMGGMVQSPFTSYGYLDVFEDELHLHGLIFGRAISYRYDISRKAPKPAQPRTDEPPTPPVVTYPPLKLTTQKTSGDVTTVPLAQAYTPGREVPFMVSTITVCLVALYAARRRKTASSLGISQA